MLGNVRVVDYYSPWLPPRFYALGADMPDNWRKFVCEANIGLNDVPLSAEERAFMELNGFTGYYCTRGHHDSSEIHVCHHHRNDEIPDYAIVWGGE